MAPERTKGPFKTRVPTIQGNARQATDGKYPNPLITTTKGSGDEETSLLDLPNEVILIVVSYLRVLRLDTTPAQASRNNAAETNRQEENSHRRTTLHALCLTCKRLNWLVTPTLYNSLVGSTTQYGIVPLRLFWETFTQKEEVQSHLQYVENLLSDSGGNSLETDLEFHGEELVYSYFEKLADIINMAPNIQQMAIVSIETDDISLWSSLIQQKPPEYEAIEFLSETGLSKLEKIAIQINGSGEDLWGFEDIFNSLLECSALTEVRVRGATSGNRRNIPSSGILKHLQRLELTECSVPLECLDDAIYFCEGLRHLKCHWSYSHPWSRYRPAEFLPNLSKLQNTLETLWLLANTTNKWQEGDQYRPQFTLRHMHALKEAKLSDFFIGNRIPEYVQDVPRENAAIAPRLPASLERLMISYTTKDVTVAHLAWAATTDLMRLAKDCSLSLPCLNELVVHFEGEGGRIMEVNTDHGPDILQAFAEQGLQAAIVGDIDVLAMLD